MEKEKIIAWLKSNSDKSGRSVRNFLYAEINKHPTGERLQKYNLLEDLKSPANGFSKKIIKQVKKVQREMDGLVGSFLVSLFLYGFASVSIKNGTVQLVTIIVAIFAGIVYYYLRAKIKPVKSRVLKITLLIIAIYLISAALIGFITGTIDSWQTIAVRTPLGSQIVSNDATTVKQLEATMGTDIDNLQNQSNTYENDIDEQTQSTAVYRSNIKAYQALEKLNNEEYAAAENYLPQISDIFEKYSQSLSSAVTAFLVADKNSTDAEDAVLSAKINYSQALLDNDTVTKIETYTQVVDDAVSNYNEAQKALTQADQNLQQAIKEFAND